MDELVNESDNNDFHTIGIPDYEYSPYIFDRLYDRDGYWTTQDIMNCINNGVHLVNHLGHSYQLGSMKMNRNDIMELTNDKFCFIYSQGCLAGDFTYLDGDCIAEYFTVKTNKGAVAGLWNTRFGWGDPGGTDGHSHRYHREFYDAVFNESLWTISKANQDSKEDNLYRIDEGAMLWCYYEITFFGDPTLKFKQPIMISQIQSLN
jgi:hypothetical protein